MILNNTITAIKGVSVGHSNSSEKSGCSVVVFDKPLNVAYVSNGGAARIYDGEVLHLDKNYYLKHAIFISDGAMSGLESSYWIAKALREINIGFKMGKTTNPSITGASIQGIYYDNYNPKSGQNAVHNLNTEPVRSGNVGAGLGADVGKFSWTDDNQCLSMKSGIGSSKIDLGNGAYICALSVVNALGNVINPDGTILAGNRNNKQIPKFRDFVNFSKNTTNYQNKSNTTISVVGTNIKLFIVQQELARIAFIASHGQSRSIFPINTSLDGDTVFAFSTQDIDIRWPNYGEEWWKLNVDIIGQMASKAVQESIYDACRQAKTISNKRYFQGIIPCAIDY